MRSESSTEAAGAFLSGSQLLERRLEVALSSGKCRLPRAEPRLEPVEQLLEPPVGHGAIVLPAPDATATAHGERHECDEHAHSCSDPGADPDQPGERRPRSRRGRRSLGSDANGGILLALEAAQGRESPRDRCTLAARPPCGRDGVEQPLVAADRRRQLTLERRTPLRDQRIRKRVGKLGGTVCGRVFRRDGDDVTRIDDVRVQRVLKRRARTLQRELRSGCVGNLRSTQERHDGGRRCALAAGVAQDADAGERRVAGGHRGHEQLCRGAIALRRRQAVARSGRGAGGDADDDG